MTDKEYQQKKAKCWEELCDEHLFDPHNIVTQGIFGYAFDRAFALGKEKETITQEEIKKAAEKYTERAYYPVGQSDCHEGFHMEAEECLAKAFKAGANFALGKQEKDTEDAVISGWVARDADENLFVYSSKPERIGTMWYGEYANFNLRNRLFPDLTWESEPIEVELIIKRKKK